MELIGKYPTTHRHICCLAYSGDGQYLLSGGKDRKVQLWNPTEKLLLNKYGGHTGDVLSVESSKDNYNFISSSVDATISLWDVEEVKTIKKFHSHHVGRIERINYNSNDSLIVSGGIDNKVSIWDIRDRLSNKPVQTMTDGNDSILDVFFSSYSIYSCCLDGFLRCYDIRNCRLTNNYICDDGITCASLNETEKCVYVHCLDECIRMFDVNTGEIFNTFRHGVPKESENKLKKDSSNFIKYQHITDKNEILSGLRLDGTIYIWDMLSSDGQPKDKHLFYEHKSHPITNIVKKPKEELQDIRKQNEFNDSSKDLQFITSQKDMIFIWKRRKEKLN
ncbi:hypothetical protein SNEBB_007361 [Seison nebaliae]|nr:hypothetical protein SNEBB_007361 [Seison nebaliae]